MRPLLRKTAAEVRRASAATLILLAFAGPAVAGDLYVSIGGSDQNPGTSDQPFKTLMRARAAIRALKAESGLPHGGITVFVSAGVYQLSESFLLTDQDSGTAEAPIVYRAEPLGSACLRGGRDIVGFAPVTDEAVRARLYAAARDKVVMVKLNDLGIRDVGQLVPRGFTQPIRPAPLELFCNNQSMTLARWPNEGFAKTGKVVDAGSRPRHNEQPTRPPRFHYSGNRPQRWTQAEDVWLFGYWKFDWADESIRVQTIDTEQGVITLAGPHHYGVEEGRDYYAENLIEELDQPGEYYFDRSSNVLYFWPPVVSETVQVAVSLLAEPLVTLHDVSHVSFESFYLELSRGDGFHVTGGSNVRIAGCTLRNLGNRGVVIEGGSNHTVLSCDIYNAGEGGICLSGGDRATLRPGGHAAINNDIYNYSRRTQTYRPAVRLDGVGQRVAHNLIHDAPHSAIIFGGNDHLIELNEIHDVLRLTGDGGAIYIGRDWSFRGNVIRHNYLHDLHGIAKWENGVYLDDQASGVAVFGNVFQDCHWGMLVGGGRDNLIENNIFLRCRLAVHFDARGLGWAKDGYDGTLLPRLQAMPYQREPWASRYPQLVNMLDHEPMAPYGNVLRNNVLYKSGKIDADIAKPVRAHGVIEHNLETDEDPGFVDLAGGDLRFKDAAVVRQQLPDFNPIPIAKIGLYCDEFRTVRRP